MDGKPYQLLLAFLVITQSLSTAASESPYEFHFKHPRFGVSVTAESIDEVYEILSLWGPEFDVLEITEERKVSETVTEFTFSAPPPSPEPGNAFYSWHWFPGEHDWSYTYEDAEAVLAYRSAKQGVSAPFPLYSGATPNGDPYTAYGHESLPSQLLIDVPWSGCEANPWEAGEISYGAYWGVVVYRWWPLYTPGPTWCSSDPINKREWSYEVTQLHRIETREGYYCGEGYYPYWTSKSSYCYNPYVLIVERRAKCSVQPPIPLEDLIAQYHSNDAEMAQLTEDLEAGANLSLRDMLTEATQQAEACVSSRFTAGGFFYQLQSGLRPQAYQAHFYDLMDKWKQLRLLQENDPEIFEACAEVRETIEAEVGRRIGETACNAPGRNHCLDTTVAENSRHPDGTAFDVSRSNVNALMAYLAKDGPPALTVKTGSTDRTTAASAGVVYTARPMTCISICDKENSTWTSWH